MKVDLCMWTKNGERFLKLVLKRIDDVIPHENVNQKILVDDHSKDMTTEIAKEFNWTICVNPKGGIPSGANEALRHVKAQFFISFEQDLVLASNWWDVVPNLLSEKKAAIACGVRLPNISCSIRNFYKSIINQNPHFTVSLDNTIYKTNFLKRLGGFPNLPFSTGVDTVLLHRVVSAGFKWNVATNVISTHLRSGLMDELRHEYWYATKRYEIERIIGLQSRPISSFARMALTSPLWGIRLALKHKNSDLAYFYPLFYFTALKGRSNGLKKGEKTPRA